MSNPFAGISILLFIQVKCSWDSWKKFICKSYSGLITKFS